MKKLTNNLKFKGGQVTIFIIVAIILVGAIVLYVMLYEKTAPGATGGESENPSAFLDTCLEDKIKEGINLVSSNGGYVAPKIYKNFKFEDEEDYLKISYLCYTKELYGKCVNLEPLLLQKIEEEIHGYISDEVDGCFLDLTKSLSDKGYVVDAVKNGFDVDILPDKLLVNINGEISLTKSGKTTKLQNFRTSVNTKIYDFAILSQSIVSNEARFCEYNFIDYMKLNPDFSIDKTKTADDSSEIYTIQYRNFPEKFRFAVRGCVYAPDY